MANVTPIFGMVAAGAVALGGYKVLIEDDVAPMESPVVAEVTETPINAVTELSDVPVIAAEAPDVTTLSTEQAVATADQPVLASADAQPGILAMSSETSTPIDVSQQLSDESKIGFPPLFMMGIMISCVTDKLAIISGDEA